MLLSNLKNGDAFRLFFGVNRPKMTLAAGKTLLDSGSTIEMFTCYLHKRALVGQNVG